MSSKYKMGVKINKIPPIKKLNREQKKVVWASPKSNAGAGWKSRFEPTNPLHIDQNWK